MRLQLPHIDMSRVLTVPARSDRPLSTVRIDGHLQTTRTSTWAWYRFGEATWQYRSVEERQSLLDRAAFAFASLAGRAVRVRVSTRPADAAEWARSFDEHTAEPLEGDDWAAYINAQKNRIESAGLVETVPVIGVRLGDKAKDLGSLADEDAEVRSALSTEGMDARPLTPAEMEWLLHRSLAPGIPVPPLFGAAVWEPQDIVALSGDVAWECIPFDRAVRVTASRNGETVTSWVTVLTVGRMQDREFPEDGSAPWLAAAAQQPWPVDVVLSGEIKRGRDLADRADLHRKWAADNLEHYQDQGEHPPAAIERAAARAAEVVDEMQSGTAIQSGRFVGVIRLVVSAPTRDECIQRARRLIRAFGERQRIDLAMTVDQTTGLRELVPGEPWATKGYQRQLPLPLLAAAVPNVTGHAGTPYGMYLGYTSGDIPRRVVLHDPHYSMEQRDQSGLVPILGDLGAGKSGLLARILYGSTLAGVAGAALDPSGPLANLCYMPELKRYAKHVDLASAQPGILDPRRLLPMPVRGDYDSDDTYEAAVGITRSQRKSVLVDATRMLLPYELQIERSTEGSIAKAVSAAGLDPWVMIQKLKDHGHSDIADPIEDAANGYARLMFPPRNGGEVDDDGLDTATLVVITMAGLQIPEVGSDKASWGIEERVAGALLHLAALYARRFVYLRPSSERKVLTIDEGHWLAAWPSGVAWVRGLIRMLRRRNIALYVGTQHPKDVSRLDPEGEAFTGGGFIGLHQRGDVAGASLQLFGLPDTPVFRAVIKSLCRLEDGTVKKGEFLHIDPTGDVERMRVDIEAPFPDLMQVANTTPDGLRNR